MSIKWPSETTELKKINSDNFGNFAPSLRSKPPLLDKSIFPVIWRYSEHNITKALGKSMAAKFKDHAACSIGYWACVIFTTFRHPSLKWIFWLLFWNNVLKAFLANSWHCKSFYIRFASANDVDWQVKCIDLGIRAPMESALEKQHTRTPTSPWLE